MEESLSTPNDAEVKVLGGLLLRPESLGRVADLLHPEDFARERHRIICAAMLFLSQVHGPISLQTVCELLEQRESLNSIGGAEYITSLSCPIEEEELIELATSIQRHATARRRLLAAGERIGL